MTKDNPLVIADTSIRQDAEGRYCLNDLHHASGSESKHQPAFFMRRKETIDLINEIKNSANSQSLPVLQIEGRNGGTFACKELVYSYAMWISPSFHLKVIRAYDSLMMMQHTALNPSNLSRLQLIQIGLQAALQSEQERQVLENKIGQLQNAVSHILQTIQETFQSESGESPENSPFQVFAPALSPDPTPFAHQMPVATVTTFGFEEFTIRAVTNATGETRFVGKDVCQVLGFHRHSMMISAHCRENPTYHRILTNRGIQPHRLLSETDVAALVERSHSPLASAFWTAVSPFRGIMGLGRGVTSPKLFRPETGVD